VQHESLVGNLDSSWGRNDKHTSAPTDKGYIAIYSNEFAFAAVKSDAKAYPFE
jgi:hypothetical protein